MSNENNKMMLLKRNNTEMVELGHHTSPSSHPQVMTVENKPKKRRRLIRKHREDEGNTFENKPKKRRRLIRKHREDEGNTFCLPEEIFLNILLFVPAKDLHDVVRYVCKQSFDIIIDPLFVRLHRQMSPAGFLIQNPNEDSKMSYIEADTTKLKVTEIEIPFPARIMGSFNGLVLLHNLTYPDIFHVMNPATKVDISLPPLLKELSDINSYAGFGLTSSGLYKVVHAKASVTFVWMSVFTVGVDRRWRFIDLQGISISNGVNLIFALMSVPRFIAGFIYWYNNVGLNGVALDVDSEVIYQFSPPVDLVRGDGNPNYFLSAGTCLGLVKHKGDVLRFWKLIGVRTGEWTKVAEINIQPVLSRVDETFYPSKLSDVWPVRLINGIFWFYRRVDDKYVVVRYDLASQTFSSFPITRVQSKTLIHPHVHTLFSPGNRKPGLLCSSEEDYNNY